MRRINLGPCCAIAAAIAFGATPITAHEVHDDIPRTAVVSAYAPEHVLLKGDLENASSTKMVGVEFTTGTLEGQDVVLFLTGISVVNAAMTVQLALDRFNIERIVYSGIAGSMDPELNLGDVMIADRWAQYLETTFAREVDGNWVVPPYFEYPYDNFGMMFPRSVTVQREGADEIETHFWFPSDEVLLDAARRAAAAVELKNCTAEDLCLEDRPKTVVGGSGVSGGTFMDNAEFRSYVFGVFGAGIVDMESAPVAHVAYANGVPFVAVRSVSDLAGGSGAENELPAFFALAADNAAIVVKALLREIPD